MGIRQRQAWAWAAWLLLAAPSGFTAAVPAGQDPPEYGISADRPTAALLRQARAQLGSPNDLTQVKALRVEGTRIRGEGALNRSSFTYSILLPGRYRSDLQTVTTVLDGPRFWRRFHVQVPGWNPSADEDREVRRRTLLGFSEACLTMLLRSPGVSGIDAKSLGRKTYGSLTGDVVEFTIAEAGTLAYVFDPATHRPVGVVSGGSMAADPSQQSLRIERFTDYQLSAGIRVPTSGEEEFMGQGLPPLAPGESRHVTRITRVVTINPPLRPADFRQPSDRQ